VCQKSEALPTGLRARLVYVRIDPEQEDRPVVELNNRETAMLVWTGIALIWMLRNRDLRRSLGSLARTVLQPVILLPVLALAAYVAGCLWLGAQVEAWNWRLINETIWWFLATGFVLLFGATRVAEEDDFFLRTAKRALTITIFAEFFVNLVVMPFWAEFLLVPILTFVVLVQVFVEHKDEMSAVKKLADNLSALIGLGLFAFVVLSLINNPSQLAPLDGLRSLLLPVVLTLLSLPFIYLTGLWVAYDSVFCWIGFQAPDPGVARRAKWTLLTRLRWRARRVGRFDRRWQNQLATVDSPDEADAVVDRFLAEQQRQAA
jgi:hypothetical protein